LFASSVTPPWSGARSSPCRHHRRARARQRERRFPRAPSRRSARASAAPPAKCRSRVSRRKSCTAAVD